jgi:hypothetical protein
MFSIEKASVGTNRSVLNREDPDPLQGKGSH